MASHTKKAQFLSNYGDSGLLNTFELVNSKHFGMYFGPFGDLSDFCRVLLAIEAESEEHPEQTSSEEEVEDRFEKLWIQ